MSLWTSRVSQIRYFWTQSQRMLRWAWTGAHYNNLKMLCCFTAVNFRIWIECLLLPQYFYYNCEMKLKFVIGGCHHLDDNHKWRVSCKCPSLIRNPSHPWLSYMALETHPCHNRSTILKEKANFLVSSGTYTHSHSLQLRSEVWHLTITFFLSISHTL